MIALYPSRLQVYDRERLDLIALLNKEAGGRRYTESDFDISLPNRVIADYCALHGILCIDLLPDFRAAAMRGAALYIGQDTHWNIAGNSLAARTQAAALRRLACRTADNEE